MTIDADATNFPSQLPLDLLHFACARSTFLPRDAMHNRGICCHQVSACLSVTFVDHVKKNKHIFEIFSPSGSHTILVFPNQRGADIPTGTPLTGASNARGYDKMTIFFTNISLYLRKGNR